MPPLTDKAASFARTEAQGETTVGQLRPTREGLQAPVSPAVDAVAEALFEADALIHDFKIAWSDVGDYRRFCYRLRAKMALAAVSPWQPIETAPKDGTEIILGDAYNVGAGFWDDGHGCHRASAGWFDEADRGNLLTAKNWPATHWMPFPMPPSAAALGNTEGAR